MKLRLPQSLFAIALTTLSFTQAATIGTGVSYDNGKGSYPYSKNEEAHHLPGSVETDTLYCWAASASNMIQYWQDSYGKDYLVNNAPTGYNTTVYDQPDGTRYLNVYEYFLANGLVDGGGTQNEAINWYFRQSPIEDRLKANVQHFMSAGTGAPDLITKYYGAGLYEYDSPSAALADLTSTLENVFSTQGQSIGLAIWQQDPEDAGREWEDFQSRSHAVTCWGYEKNADGVVNALYLSDSDDMEYGVFKVHLTIGQSVPMGGMPSLDAIIMQTDDQIDGYGGYVVNLTDLYAITPNPNPDSEEGVTQYYKDYAKEATPLPTLSSAQDAQTVEVIETNTIISGSVERSGAGVKVGKDVAQGAPSIVMLVSETPDSALTLTGNGNGTGLDVTLGSMASVANLSVSGYERGVNAEGKVYLYGRSIDVSGNERLDDENGAGIRNTNYVEIKDCESVLISGNFTLAGQGGGIYNEDVVSISDNGAVIFEYNIAGGGGNDIYNAAGASLNIADNDSVLFSGMYYSSPAVVNDGNMYVKSTKDSNGIKFQDSALDSSKGVTYLGRDINGETSATTVAFTETDWEAETPTALVRLAMTTGEDGLVTVLNHLSVNAHEIMGVGAETSSLMNANVFATNDITLSDLKMDSSNHFTGSGTTLTLNNLVIDLAGVDLISDSFDISNMFDEFGGMMIDNVYLDASSLDLYDGWDEASSVTVNFGDSLKGLDEGTKLTVLLGNNMMTSQWEYQAGGNVTFRGAVIVPEPTTGTLSLIALAGLATRRRRK